jgi:hypothetical protein
MFPETEKERAAVDRLIPILDAIEPGWRDRVNADTLNLADWHDCLIGQVFGSFTEGKEIIYKHIGGVEVWYQSELFFATLPGDVEPLEDYWRERIEETREKSA